MVEGSTCGRAGRRLRRMIVFVFLGAERESSVVAGGRRMLMLLTVERVVLGEGDGEFDGEI